MDASRFTWRNAAEIGALALALVVFTRALPVVGEAVAVVAVAALGIVAVRHYVPGGLVARWCDAVVDRVWGHFAPEGEPGCPEADGWAPPPQRSSYCTRHRSRVR